MGFNSGFKGLIQTSSVVLDEQHKVRQTPSLHYAFIFYT